MVLRTLRIVRESGHDLFNGALLSFRAAEHCSRANVRRILDVQRLSAAWCPGETNIRPGFYRYHRRWNSAADSMAVRRRPSGLGRPFCSDGGDAFSFGGVSRSDKRQMELARDSVP